MILVFKISYDAALVVCTECSTTVTSFDALYSLVQKNHNSSITMQVPDCEIKDEETTDNFSECVFVKDLPHIDMPGTSYDHDKMKNEIKDELGSQECGSDGNLSDDDPKIPSDSCESYKRDSPMKKKRTSRATRKTETVGQKIKTRRYFASEKVAKFLEHDQIVREFCTLQCEICEKETFENFLAMHRHYRKFHPDVQASITCCGRKLTSRHNAVEHITDHHVIKFQKCSECEQLFKTMKALYQHMCTEHLKYQCWVCQRGFLQQKTMQNHLKLCELTGNKFECIICKKDTFPSFVKLREHLLFHKQVESEKKAGAVFFCDICSFSTSSRSGFSQHQKKHKIAKYFEEKGGYKCEICGKTLRSERTLEIHHEVVHTEPVLQECKLCGKKVRWMTSHLACHKNDPMLCPTCGASCKNKTLLRSHIRAVHKIQATLECHYCDKKFKRKNQLAEHEATHTVRLLWEILNIE